jgi:hypothetical protein
MSDRNFVDDRHALYAGWVLGVALNNGLDALPVVDADGNATDRITVQLQRPADVFEPVVDVTITLVVPPPPDDWRLDG